MATNPAPARPGRPCPEFNGKADLTGCCCGCGGNLEF